jgi:peptide/nickel transport system permease protein
VGPGPLEYSAAGAPVLDDALRVESGGRSAGSRLSRSVLGDLRLAIPIGVVVAIILLAAIGPVLWNHSTSHVNLAQTLRAPSLAHPMGTDEYGRDVFARFMQGARISLAVGFAMVFAGTVVGGLIGLVAGTARGWTDTVAMRVMDSLLAFPALVLSMAVAIGLGPSLWTASLGVVIATIPWYARVLRSDVLRVSNAAYVEAAAALGASRRRIIARHIVPHVMPTLLIQSTATFGYSILAVAGLSFIGLGAQIPTPEWGAMITEGFNEVLVGAWWIGVFPGLGLLVCVVAAGAITDRLRDRWDPANAVRGG